MLHTSFWFWKQIKLFINQMDVNLVIFTGYNGRIAIGELFIINDEIKRYLKVKLMNTLMKLATKME